MRPGFKIALAQVNTTVGDFEGIVRKVGLFTQKAKSRGVDLIAFPELTTTGYPPRDLVEVPAFVEKNLRALEEIARLSQGIAIIVGAVGKNEQPGGKPLFNSAVLCRDGRVQSRYVKNLLPNYDVFDEGRYFEPGTQTGLWDLPRATEETSVGFTPRESPEGAVSSRRPDEGFGERAVSLPAKIGISICEDAWNDKLFWEKRLYSRDPIEEQIQQGAEVLLNVSASPFSVGKAQLRRELLQALALKYGIPIFYVNLVGGNDELVFDGRSLAINEKGQIIAEGKAFQEDLLVVEYPSPASLLPEPMRDEEDLFQALIFGIRDYVRKCGFKKLALGLSGGIDSSLTAVLAVKAVGSKNVLGVIMPSPYSSRESVEDAETLAGNLKIRSRILSINLIYRSYRGLFKRGSRPPDLADENLQARIRGNLLMALSNREGYLVLSTGNKSELAVGYCTMYGDMSGGLAVISDLPKKMVYDLSRWINRRSHVIPERVFTKPPSAELRPNQTDQDTLPPYEVLDPILKGYIEDHKSEEELVAQGFSRKTVRWVLKRVARNEYKRRQAAPGIKVTSKAFGIGRRFPIARKC